MNQKLFVSKLAKNIATIASALFVTVLLANGEKLDNLVLLEKRNSGYWKYLEASNKKRIRVAGALVKGEKDKNILVATWKNTEQNGISANVNDDNTITFNGNNEGDDFNIMTTSIQLPEGIYSFTYNADSISGIDDGINMYLWDQQERKTVDISTGVFIDGDKDYHLGIHIKKGAVLDNVTVYPMIRLGEYSDYTYNTVETIDIAEVYFCDMENITERDLEIFVHSNAQSKIDWNSIILPSGYGLELHKNYYKYGKISPVGIVDDAAINGINVSQMYDQLIQQR